MIGNRFILLLLFSSLVISCKVHKEIAPLLEAAAGLDNPKIVYVLDASCSICIGECVDFIQSLRESSDIPLQVVCQSEQMELLNYYFGKAFSGNKVPEISPVDDMGTVDTVSANNVYLYENNQMVNYYYYTANSLYQLSGDFYPTGL